jgi:hypothetical protein
MEKQEALPMIGDLWIHVDPSLLGGTMMFFKPKHAKNTIVEILDH